jgi:hypothetical protein
MPESDSDRPTALPPFDPRAFARESESRMVAAPIAGPPISDVSPLGVSEDEILARFGSRASVLVLRVAFDEVKTLALDHREGFLLSLIDGSSNVDQIFDMCGMPPIEAARILCRLAAEGVIAFQ